MGPQRNLRLSIEGRLLCISRVFFSARKIMSVQSFVLAYILSLHVTRTHSSSNNGCRNTECEFSILTEQPRKCARTFNFFFKENLHIFILVNIVFAWLAILQSRSITSLTTNLTSILTLCQWFKVQFINFKFSSQVFLKRWFIRHWLNYSQFIPPTSMRIRRTTLPRIINIKS